MKKQYSIEEKITVGQPSYQFPDEQKTVDQHYVDLLNGKIAPANEHERQFLKEAEEAKEKGLIPEIPIN
jgi:hypothetical protein